MGAIGGLLGMKGGAGGTGFGTNPGIDPTQINTAYTGVQGALGNQNSLLSALQGQNGLQNQSNVYNQLQGVVSGQGPNPAQAMLNQATGQNVANQAALMAGQRGAGANVGLMARQSAQQGANLQQQAAGQGASMQAQQALGALGQAGTMAGNMAANQIGQTNANTAAQQAEQQALLGANASHNAIQGQLANTTMQGQQGLVGGVMNGVGSILGLADGGQVPGQAFGPQSMFGQFINQGMPQSPQFGGSNPGAEGLQKGVGGAFGHKKAKSPDPMEGAIDVTDSMGNMDGLAASKGGRVPVVVSPGERILKPGEAQAVAKGKTSPMKVGGQVPGKAEVKGDSYKNDKVPGKLPPGSVVIPRSVMQNKNPEKGAAEFVRAVMAKKRTKS